MTLWCPSDFPKPLAYPRCRETRVEFWVPELVSPLPQKRWLESEGIPGQLENYRAGESGRWYFPGLGKQFWEQDRQVCPASEEKQPLSAPLTFGQELTCFMPCALGGEQTAWSGILGPIQQ